MGWISHRNGVDNPCMSSLAKSERRFCRNIPCRLRKLLPKDIDNRPTENSLLSVKYTRIIPRPIFFRDGLKKKKTFIRRNRSAVSKTIRPCEKPESNENPISKPNVSRGFLFPRSTRFLSNTAAVTRMTRPPSAFYRGPIAVRP